MPKENAMTATLTSENPLLAYAGKYLTFVLGRETYGLQILKVQEIIGILPVTRVPRTPAFMRGVVNLRGKVIPVIDLRRKFEMPDVPDGERTCIIVVQLEGTGSKVITGIIVDEVSEVMNVASEQLEPAPDFGSEAKTDFILGMGKVGQKVVMLIDAEKVLSRQEVAAVENLQPKEAA
jgi:purine-binding chemotaxis protein CheW